jgi:hypothetical protein
MRTAKLTAIIIILILVIALQMIKINVQIKEIERQDRVIENRYNRVNDSIKKVFYNNGFDTANQVTK